MAEALAPDTAAWRPNARQEEFLAAGEDEVLYGGAAGGGKTDALVIDALGLQQDAILIPEYRGLLLRRTYDELREVLDRMAAVYPTVALGATYRSGDRYWQFQSGARIELGYLDADADVYRYQSRQFQWIGWEELAQWPTPKPYAYLQTRLRVPKNVPLTCYTRATCNPDGPGARWIANHWGIKPEGGPSLKVERVDMEREDGTKEQVVMRRRFVPARLADNPYLGSDYRAKLMKLDDQTRAALLDGRWDEPRVDGAIYFTQVSQARNEGRVTSVPYDPTLRVDTVWDLGIGDATAIFFVQTVGREVRLIDYYEASGEGLPHYAQVLDKRGYLYGKHYAPHDIQVRELGSGRSRIETAATLGIRFEVVPNIGVEEGIHATRMLFPRLWIDERKCEAALLALQRYRRSFNARLGEFTETPVHDWCSHCADALRYLAVSHKPARPPAAEERRVITVGSGSSSASHNWMAS